MSGSGEIRGISPIGYVRNSFDRRQDPDAFLGTQSEIHVLEDYSEGLCRLDNYRRLYVIFLFHKSEGYRLVVHPRGDVNRPRRGVFATRSPRRPNPIGLTVVELIGVDGNVVTVQDLDALNGTPVLDIKPCKDDVTY